MHFSSGTICNNQVLVTITVVIGPRRAATRVVALDGVRIQDPFEASAVDITIEKIDAAVRQTAVGHVNIHEAVVVRIGSGNRIRPALVLSQIVACLPDKANGSIFRNFLQQERILLITLIRDESIQITIVVEVGPGTPRRKAV